MAKELTPDNFIDCWKGFTHDRKTILLENYDNSTEWTKATIGEKRSKDKGSPFGEHFKIEFGNIYTYRTEDGSVDLSIFKEADHVKRIKTISKKNHTEWDPDNFPINYDVLLEHENDVSLAHEEMFKLTYFRATLKVLVTYLWDADEKENWDSVHRDLCDNFESIINQTNVQYPENPNTRYLLIVGQRVGNEIKWKFNVFKP